MAGDLDDAALVALTVPSAMRGSRPASAARPNGAPTPRASASGRRSRRPCGAAVRRRRPSRGRRRPSAGCCARPGGSRLPGGEGAGDLVRSRPARSARAIPSAAAAIWTAPIRLMISLYAVPAPAGRRQHLGRQRLEQGARCGEVGVVRPHEEGEGAGGRGVRQAGHRAVDVPQPVRRRSRPAARRARARASSTRPRTPRAQVRRPGPLSTPSAPCHTAARRVVVAHHAITASVPAAASAGVAARCAPRRPGAPSRPGVRLWTVTS